MLEAYQCSPYYLLEYERDYHGFDSPLGIGVGRGHVLATATGLKSLPWPNMDLGGGLLI